MPPTVPTGQKLHPVTISFSSPGAQPPVFVAGTITQPPWKPQLMDVEKSGKDEFAFKSLFHLPAGNYQYKFRLGGGDWWLCDSSSPKVTSEEGILNNELVVQDFSPQPPSDVNGSNDSSEGYVSAPEISLPNQPSSAPITPGPAPDRIKAPTSTPVTPGLRDRLAMHLDLKSNNKQAQLLKERFQERGDDPYAGVGDGDDTPLSGSGAPLLPHEIGAPPPTPPEEKSIVSTEVLPVPASPSTASPRRTSSSSCKSRSTSRVPLPPTQEDLHDPNVERFPEDRKNILKRIQTLKHELPEDETRDIEAIESSEDEASEDGSDEFTELPEETYSEPVTTLRPKETGNTGKTGANVLGSSHEHLDAVIEYDEANFPDMVETRAECAGLGIPSQSRSEPGDNQPVVPPSASPVASIDGAEDERQGDEEIGDHSVRRHKNLRESVDNAWETDDESDYARSDTGLLVATIKRDRSWKRFWELIQEKLLQFWHFISGGSNRAKSE